MGWCIDTLMPEINRIFRRVKFEVVKPQANPPYVYFNYQEEITLEKKKELIALFPPDVYVIFYPFTLVEETAVAASSTTFPGGEIAKTTEPGEPVKEVKFAHKGDTIRFPGRNI